VRLALGFFVLLSLAPFPGGSDTFAVQQAPTELPAVGRAEKERFLWDELTSAIMQIDRELDGVLGVAIPDLTSGRQWLLHGDEIFPQASSIKIAVLAELYRQAQDRSPKKAKLTDLYTVREADLVPDSDVLLGLTPGVTCLTNRDLATCMVSVSDNSATG
jgi:beta-lactamase class A